MFRPCFRCCGNVAMTTAADCICFNTTIFSLALEGKLQSSPLLFLRLSSTECPWTSCGWSTKGQRRAHSFWQPEGGRCSYCGPSHIQYILCGVCFRLLSISCLLHPPALVDKTPTLPTAYSNSAPRLHGYAGLLSKIKPLNPLFAVWPSSSESFSPLNHD